MSAHDDLGLRLRGHFLTTADVRVADGALEAVLARTRTLTPRPTVLVVLQRRSMLGPMRLAGTQQRVRWAAIAVLVILALVAALLAGRPPTRAGPGLLAYSRDGAVYVAGPDGTDPVLVADDAIDLRVRAWSPAGDLLAVQSSEPAVFALDATSGSIRRIAAGTFIAWAADGQSILVDQFSNGVQFITLDGDVVREVGRFELPALSPDGRWLAGERDGNLVVVDLTSGVETNVATVPHHLSRTSDWDGATWSSDSLSLAHVQRRGDQIGVVVVKRDGSASTLLEPTVHAAGRLSWSPDGAWIAYLDAASAEFGETRKPRLMVVRPDGRDLRSLVDEVGEVVVGETSFGWDRFVWSPDAARIAYFSPDGELHQVELATSVSTRLGPPGTGTGSVAWQRSTAVVPRPEPTAAAVSVDPPASAIPLGVPPQAPPADPERTWRSLLVGWQIADGGPDDLKCAADSVDLATGDATRIATELAIDQGNSSYSCGPWSPDRSHLVVPRSPTSLAVLDIAGADVASIDASAAGLTRVASVEWSPAGGWLLVRGCLPAPATASPSPSAVASGALDPSCPPAWFMTRPDGSNQTTLVGEPRWSSDDAVMAVSAPDGTLLVGPGDGAALVAIGLFPLPAGWSPDATEFVYLDAGDAWIADADGSGVRNLSGFKVAGATVVSWSPDGRFIAVIHGRTVWLMPPPGAERIPIELGAARPGALRWSPDGRVVAIESYDAQAFTPLLVLVATDGPSAVVVEGARPVAWSPDSAFLLIASFEGDALEVIRADGSGRRVVASGLGNPSVPRWVE